MYVYNGDHTLHKNKHKRVRAELRHNYYTCYRSNLQSQFCRTDTLKKKKKSVNNLGIKLYSNLLNHIKNLENRQIFRNKLKLFLLQQAYSVNDYLLYEYLSWKM